MYEETAKVSEVEKMYRSSILIGHILFSLVIVVPVYVGVMVFILVTRHFVDSSIDSLLEALLTLIKLFWILSGIFVLINFIGLILYGPTQQRSLINRLMFISRGGKLKYPLIITYVSRGDNHAALSRAIKTSLQVLSKLGVSACFEVVTDKPVPKVAGNNIYYFVVPEDYQTKNKAKYKARALQYLVEYSHLRVNTKSWILHLDEESVVTPDLIYGISKFWEDGRFQIGQGEIKYNAYNYGQNILTTAIDAIRTGDDLGRFRLQFNLLNRPIFGMHGSFILVSSSLERKIGFDLGGRGSITEDAYFALSAYDRGYKFGWVDGYISEQSPFSVGDLIKQRRRWFCGLLLVATDSKLSLKVRLPLLLSVGLWAVSWVSPIAVVLTILLGGYFPLPLLAISAVISGGFSAIYIVGVYRNLADIKMRLRKKIYIFVSTVFLVPVSSVVEAVAVLYGIFRPIKVFEVVSK